MKMTVLGTGYLGATHAACMADLGHEVLGVDVDGAKIKSLQNGVVPFYEPGLTEILERNIASGRLVFSQSYEDAAAFSSVHFLAVGTPQQKGSFAADLSHIESVIDELVPLIKAPATIFGKSTVPVGTAERLARRANELAVNGANIELAWNPEFLREGHAVADTTRPDRVVVGSSERSRDQVEAVARAVYRDALEAGAPLLLTDLATAELVKVSANAFLATKISFINAIAEVCEAAGANVVDLADALGYDDRIGRKFLNAGLGFGGGCLPKDIRAFMARAGELGADQAFTLLREVDQINMRRRVRMVDVARVACGGSFIGKSVAVLGAAFKPDSDDVRDSPALNVAGQIQLQGANVTVYDPKAMDNSKRIYPTLEYADSADQACSGADLVMVLTEWPEFTSLDPSKLRQSVRYPAIVDGRICLNRESWLNAGWEYLT